MASNASVNGTKVDTKCSGNVNQFQMVKQKLWHKEKYIPTTVELHNDHVFIIYQKYEISKIDKTGASDKKIIGTSQALKQSRHYIEQTSNLSYIEVTQLRHLFLKMLCNF